MDVLFSVLVLCILFTWARHRERYQTGQTQTPFFSLGRRRAAAARRRRPRRYPKAAASTAQATPRAVKAAVRKISTYTHNEPIAARLLESTRRANMAKPLAWCVDKTIADLLRDRH